ncbi:hypothetical protein FRC01_005440 [Tulasnella sp. 417]|nr:hypothetical protein FRC01_005440 [Tulasnella sp. 417]
MGSGSSVLIAGSPRPPRLPEEPGSSKPCSPTSDEPTSTSAAVWPPPPPEKPFDQARDGPSNGESGVEPSIPPEIDPLQELASIESNSTPITKDIVDIILAIGRAIPKAIRNKHQLYRILIRSRDLCNHLHLMLQAEVGSSSEMDTFKQCWEMMDCLERALLDLADIVSEEMVPFGESSLATWQGSGKRLCQLLSDLIAPPFHLCNVSDQVQVHAERDQYFDDCSWASLVLVAGIEGPIHDPKIYPSFLIEAQNTIDRLNYLVNEMKLNRYLQEWTRDLFIEILSEIATLAMKGPETASLGFWAAASSALNVIDLEKGLESEVVISLHRSWSGFADDWILPLSKPKNFNPPRTTPCRCSMI